MHENNAVEQNVLHIYTLSAGRQNDNETNDIISTACLNQKYVCKGVYSNLDVVSEHDRFDHSIRMVRLDSLPVSDVVKRTSLSRV